MSSPVDSLPTRVDAAGTGSTRPVRALRNAASTSSTVRAPMVGRAGIRGRPAGGHREQLPDGAARVVDARAGRQVGAGSWRRAPARTRPRRGWNRPAAGRRSPWMDTCHSTRGTDSWEAVPVNAPMAPPAKPTLITSWRSTPGCASTVRQCTSSASRPLRNRPSPNTWLIVTGAVPPPRDGRIHERLRLGRHAADRGVVGRAVEQQLAHRDVDGDVHELDAPDALLRHHRRAPRS